MPVTSSVLETRAVTPPAGFTLRRSASAVIAVTITAPAPATVLPLTCVAVMLSSAPELTAIAPRSVRVTVSRLDVAGMVIARLFASSDLGISSVLSGNVAGPVNESDTLARCCEERLPAAATATTEPAPTSVMPSALLKAEACAAVMITVMPSFTVSRPAFDNVTAERSMLLSAAIPYPLASIAKGRNAVLVGR